MAEQQKNVPYLGEAVEVLRLASYDYPKMLGHMRNLTSETSYTIDDDEDGFKEAHVRCTLHQAITILMRVKTFELTMDLAGGVYDADDDSQIANLDLTGYSSTGIWTEEPPTMDNTFGRGMSSDGDLTEPAFADGVASVYINQFTDPFLTTESSGANTYYGGLEGGYDEGIFKPNIFGRSIFIEDAERAEDVLKELDPRATVLFPLQLLIDPLGQAMPSYAAGCSSQGGFQSNFIVGTEFYDYNGVATFPAGFKIETDAGLITAPFYLGTVTSEDIYFQWTGCEIKLTATEYHDY